MLSDRMVCRVCGESKPPEQMKSRLGKPAAICKSCDCVRAKAYHFANREKRLAYIRNYRLRPERLQKEKERSERRSADAAHREQQRLRNRRVRSLDEFKAKSREYQKEYARRKREVASAHAAVKYALKTGRLVAPSSCVKCDDGTFRLHAHHEDYAKPLDVLWLCPRCHSLTHKEKRSA